MRLHTVQALLQWEAAHVQSGSIFGYEVSIVAANGANGDETVDTGTTGTMLEIELLHEVSSYAFKVWLHTRVALCCHGYQWDGKCILL